jgi:hypothetical protein
MSASDRSPSRPTVMRTSIEAPAQNQIRSGVRVRCSTVPAVTEVCREQAEHSQRCRRSRSRLIGSTGRTETFGHKRLSMLGYADRVSLNGSPPQIDIRPLFIGWRLAGRKADRIVDDRREVAPVQLDQFSKIDGKRSTSSDRAALKEMKEEEVKTAFAEIIGEPFIPKDWGGETSDLSTSRLTMNGAPLTAGFAFKGPAQRGTLQIASMGKNGDQAIRLAHESVGPIWSPPITRGSRPNNCSASSGSRAMRPPG